MEDQGKLNLNESVQGLRKDLEDSPALAGGDLDELEAHLRDSFEMKRAAGTPEEEAFAQSAQSLGRPWELEVEYAKANPGRIWINRCGWMLLGYYAFLLMRQTSSMVESSLVRLANTIDASIIGLLSVISQWVVYGVLGAGFGLLLLRRAGAAEKTARFLARRPLLPFMAIVAFPYASTLLWEWLRGQAGHPGLSAHSTSILETWFI